MASQPLELTQDDLRFATLVADRLAFGLDNVRLYRELGKQKSLLESILDSMSEAVYVADRKGSFIVVNSAVAAQCGTLGKEEGPLGMAIVGLDYRLVRANATLCRMLGYGNGLHRYSRTS